MGFILRLENTQRSAHPVSFHTLWSCPQFLVHCTPSTRSYLDRRLWDGTCERRDPTLFSYRFTLLSFQKCLSDCSIQQSRWSSQQSCSFPSVLWNIPTLTNTINKSVSALRLRLGCSFPWVNAASIPWAKLVNKYLMGILSIMTQSS